MMPIRPNLLERTALFSLNAVPGVMLDVGGALAFQALSLASQMGLFEKLANGPLTPAELAKQLDSHERGTMALLSALESIGYVDQRDGRFANSAMTKKWMLDPELFNIDAALTFWSAVFSQLLPQAPAVLQTGERPYGNVYAWLEENPELSHAFQQQLMANATLTGNDIAKKLKIRPSAGKLLDVGGGHGLFSIMMCQQYPNLKGTILDSPVALRTAEQIVEKHGMERRISLRAGDLWQEEWGTGYDVILLFNLIHHYDDEQNMALLRRCAAALNQGGQLAILDQIEGHVPGSMANAFIQLIALHYFLLADGRVYDRDTIQDWLGEAGFGQARFHRMVKAPGTSLMVARLL
jgi:cyclopropane fatty-acyl-phospholipid synthase-like methyltransferase